MKELREKLVGGVIIDIKQTNETFIFKIYNKNQEFFLKIILPKAIYISTDLKEKGETTQNFSKLLKRHLSQKIIESVNQHEFDRIIKINTHSYKLIIELFGHGNLILTNSNSVIIGAFKRCGEKHRHLRIKTIYKYPPSSLNPFRYKPDKLQKIFKKINREIVKALAMNFGFGRIYAREICERAKINKSRFASVLSQNEVVRLFEVFRNLERENIKPFIVFDGNKKIDVIPLEMQIYEKYKKYQFDSFNTALENYFEDRKIVEKVEKIKIEKEKIKEVKEKGIRLQTLKAKEQEYRKIGHLLQKEHAIFDKILKEMTQWKLEKNLKEPTVTIRFDNLNIK
jgi:predicted ribosome quality control (RQC) complex YloA/Tae2 family protein